ncbi:NAD(P)-dependent dehydrogenase (short-subunit alcohol dehydrogenase family) [Mycetocola sp. CAN_C7]|uniref:SDR family NAD(P)-dependent oxidoreductase n=1 Tax=Mycetocola sp. CAN_C7 TaxID=2787724 RepID=UPI0018CAAAF8
MAAVGAATRVAFLAGGTSGIGLAVAHELAASGHIIVLGGRSEERTATAVGQFVGSVVTGQELDTTDDASTDAAIAAVLEAHGRIDILVNSVGSAPAGHFDDVDSAGWASALDSKVIGAVRLMRAATPAMRSAGYGRIVHIAGTAGREPEPWMATAGAANAALLALTKASSLQLAADGITVNAVCPGPIATSRWDGLVAGFARISGQSATAAEEHLRSGMPLGRPGEAADVAALVAFLVSEQARHITGTSVVIDGGQSRSI